MIDNLTSCPLRMQHSCFRTSFSWTLDSISASIESFQSIAKPTRLQAVEIVSDRLK